MSFPNSALQIGFPARNRSAIDLTGLLDLAFEVLIEDCDIACGHKLKGFSVSMTDLMYPRSCTGFCLIGESYRSCWSLAPLFLPCGFLIDCCDSEVSDQVKWVSGFFGLSLSGCFRLRWLLLGPMSGEWGGDSFNGGVTLFWLEGGSGGNCVSSLISW